MPMNIPLKEPRQTALSAETLSTRHHPKVLASVLSHLAVGQPWKEIDQVESLPLDAILYQPWAPNRTRRAMGYFTAGSPFPPISVFAYRMPHPVTQSPSEDLAKDSLYRIFYDVGDGNHRCSAAERCGETHIQAEVSGVVTIDPFEFMLSDQKLWLQEGRFMRLITEPTALSMEYLRLWVPEHQ